jgi:hypothetical protein
MKIHVHGFKKIDSNNENEPLIATTLTPLQAMFVCKLPTYTITFKRKVEYSYFNL